MVARVDAILHLLAVAKPVMQGDRCLAFRDNFESGELPNPQHKGQRVVQPRPEGTFGYGTLPLPWQRGQGIVGIVIVGFHARFANSFFTTSLRQPQRLALPPPLAHLSPGVPSPPGALTLQRSSA